MVGGDAYRVASMNLQEMQLWNLKISRQKARRHRQLLHHKETQDRLNFHVLLLLEMKTGKNGDSMDSLAGQSCLGICSQMMSFSSNMRWNMYIRILSPNWPKDKQANSIEEMLAPLKMWEVVGLLVSGWCWLVSVGLYNSLHSGTAAQWHDNTVVDVGRHDVQASLPGRRLLHHPN